MVDERDDGYCIEPLDLRVDEEVEAFREAVKPKSVNVLTRSHWVGYSDSGCEDEGFETG